MDTKISVIIPTHNNELDINRAISSILNNSFKDVEIIVINDDSSDKTLEIINSLAKDNKNIVIKNVNNHSALKNRLEGARLAKGKYLMFLDADDYFTSDALEVMYKTITSGDYDLVNCNFFFLRKNGLKKALFKKNKELDKYEAINALFKDTYFRGYMHTKIYKKELVLKIKEPNISNIMYEDLLFNFLYLLNVDKVKTIKNALHIYNKTNENSVTSTGYKRSIHNVMVRNAIRNKIEEINDDRLRKIFLKSKFRSRLLLFSDYLLSSFPNKKEKRNIKKSTKSDFKNIYSKHFDIKKSKYIDLVNI